ncbi:hypothetical protein J3R30DRAFT_3681188 [Lentinula aciculospora]|uniref:Uncharacterized protein n=1 Tax=Lentinula aciculospora TaxID=153920 RepID=A0A9W9DT03_9AGAR|nr:hypothetical protein J3R30DRAFT_3681188 [Lentinula aciculospora]
MSVALPPGFYTIRVHNDTKTVASPSSAGGNLAVNTSSGNKEWQIDGDGVITSLSTGNSPAQAQTNNHPAQPGDNVVANTGNPLKWIISGVKYISSGSY